MAGVRITTGRRSREPGTSVGVQVNLFGMARLEESVNGGQLAEILTEVMQPSLEQAESEWPVLTGASKDSLRLDVIEVGERHARVALQVGGEQLINDPRNESGRDYAPHIEFNGTPNAPPGIIFNATYGRDSEIRQELHNRVAALVRGLL